MANDVQLLFMCFFTMSLSSSVKCLYTYFVCVSVCLIFILSLRILYILDISPLFDEWFSDFFTKPVICILILSPEFFTEQNF